MVTPDASTTCQSVVGAVAVSALHTQTPTTSGEEAIPPTVKKLGGIAPPPTDLRPPQKIPPSQFGVKLRKAVFKSAKLRRRSLRR